MAQLSAKTKAKDEQRRVSNYHWERERGGGGQEWWKEWEVKEVMAGDDDKKKQRRTTKSLGLLLGEGAREWGGNQK